jgi:hypothetical protein
MNSFRMLRNQSGQATMEAVLIMIAIMSVVTVISRTATNQGFIRNIVEGPWSPLRGMIEDGVWMRHTISKSHHPNQFPRHQSKRGDDI